MWPGLGPRARYRLQLGSVMVRSGELLDLHGHNNLLLLLSFATTTPK